jgi:hypothetical protein
MGTLIGWVVGLGIIGSAWSGDLSFWGIGVFVIAALVGIFLMPMTVGTFMTSIMFSSIIALIAGFINGNNDSALTALAIGIGSFVTQLIIGALRPDVR